MLSRKLNKTLIYTIFIFLLMTHYFEIEVCTKLIFPPNKCFFSLSLTLVQDFRGDFSLKISRKYNEIFLVGFYEFAVNAGDVIKTFCISLRTELGQIVVSSLVLGQKNHGVSVIFSSLFKTIFNHV